MIENGYIRLHRTITGWRWYKDGNVLRLWLHLLLNANYEQSEFQDKIIGRGEQVTSLKALSESTGLSIQEVRTALGKLKRTGEILVNSNRHFTIVSILNYDKFQSDSADKQQTVNTQSTNKQQNQKKKKKQKILYPPVSPQRRLRKKSRFPGRSGMPCGTGWHTRPNGGRATSRPA